MATRSAQGGGSVSANAEMPAGARATVATAERAGGASVGEAIGAIKNNGGGELRIKASDGVGMGVLKTMLPSNFLQDEKGNVALFNPENELKVFNMDGKEVKFGNTITVMVTENGISIKNMDSLGRLMPPKSKAEISPELALAINQEFIRGNQGIIANSRSISVTDAAGLLPSLKNTGSGIASDYFTIKGTGRTKEEKEAKANRQKARDLGIEGIAND